MIPCHVPLSKTYPSPGQRPVYRVVAKVVFQCPVVVPREDDTGRFAESFHIVGDAQERDDEGMFKIAENQYLLIKTLLHYHQLDLNSEDSSTRTHSFAIIQFPHQGSYALNCDELVVICALVNISESSFEQHVEEFAFRIPGTHDVVQNDRTRYTP